MRGVTIRGLSNDRAGHLQPEVAQGRMTEPCVKVSALRALLYKWVAIAQDPAWNGHIRIGYTDCANDLAVLCEKAEQP
jgi:hypothetical protein